MAKVESYRICNKHYMTIDGAAKFLRLSRDWLATRIKHGQLKTVKIELRELIELDILVAYRESHLAHRG